MYTSETCCTTSATSRSSSSSRTPNPTYSNGGELPFLCNPDPESIPTEPNKGPNPSASILRFFLVSSSRLTCHITSSTQHSKHTTPTSLSTQPSPSPLQQQQQQPSSPPPSPSQHQRSSPLSSSHPQKQQAPTPSCSPCPSHSS